MTKTFNKRSGGKTGRRGRKGDIWKSAHLMGPGLSLGLLWKPSRELQDSIAGVASMCFLAPRHLEHELMLAVLLDC